VREGENATYTLQYQGTLLGTATAGVDLSIIDITTDPSDYGSLSLVATPGVSFDGTTVTFNDPPQPDPPTQAVFQLPIINNGVTDGPRQLRLEPSNAQTTNPPVLGVDPPARSDSTIPTTTIIDPAPLLLADPPAQPPASSSLVREEQLQSLVDAAIAEFADAGLPPEQLEALANVDVAVADLPGARLGENCGVQVVLDVDAAGAGWFIDPTPYDNSEFQSSNGTLQAIDATFASGRVDLLTVIAHELGHILGWKDLGPDDHNGTSDLMHATLAAGQRKLPSLAPNGLGAIVR
jgi:hypothetical protein